MTDTYAKTSPNIAPAPTGADGDEDVTSGCQVATVNGTIGDASGATNLPGQSIADVVESPTFHVQQ